ncbi:MAG: succinate dehydrogenase [Planctomycetota bacterium]|nr:MAG: succinate dehydrogenase [Planctomycetota bacterium]REJ88571.1 MAG: succinate dehydrogenase [Planctomycetota bacterium]REK17543.1 MAG: succinate dehydrogenase [Planctomycetota bacterium]REK47452.1 MAG: succinate dehydrogenase [Planctomycetota bacterium]
MTKKPSIDHWNGTRIAPGECRNVKLSVGESYSGATVKIPIHIRRSEKDGPTIFVTAAMHGNEINGSGAIRALVQDRDLELSAGSLILVPVLNILGFDRHSRYLPDRRDLNRCFPGSSKGSLASRMARVIFDEIVARSDFGIDLHTAAIRRTNFPNIRADMTDEKVEQLARAFGCQAILSGKGPKGSLRREACEASCPTIVFEGGEVSKVEPGIVEAMLRGIRNVLAEFGMTAERAVRCASQVVINKTKWVRADRGGFLQFHIAPGDIVQKDQAIATNTSLLGEEQNVLAAPFNGLVLGLTTLPAVSPGEPVCHLGQLPKSERRIESLREDLASDRLHGRVADDLASSIVVVDPEGGS